VSKTGIKFRLSRLFDLLAAISCIYFNHPETVITIDLTRNLTPAV
jgi:hypothetical protein